MMGLGSIFTLILTKDGDPFHAFLNPVLDPSDMTWEQDVNGSRDKAANTTGNIFVDSPGRLRQSPPQKKWVFAMRLKCGATPWLNMVGKSMLMLLMILSLKLR